MPELPEVETVKNALKKYVINKTISDVIFLKHNIVKEDENAFKKNVINKKILSLERIGKFLIFHLEKNTVMISHLRMEGKWIPGKNKNDISKYSRVIFVFKDKTILNYDDSRMFGILLTKTEKDYKVTPPISLLGKEAIDNIDIKKIYSIIHKDKRKIKEVLLDQHIISGLGNIYVDETLYASKISPLSNANKLSIYDIKNILCNAKKILLSSIKNNGSTIHSFTWDQGKSGGFQKFLKVYGKKGELCPICKTPFVKTFIGGRGTTYCPNCQVLKSNKYILGITGPVSSGKSTAIKEFSKLRYKSYSCDKTVEKIYKNKDFQNKMIKEFGTYSKDKIRNIVVKDNKKINKLNQIIHPLVKKDLIDFIKNNNGKIVIEIPLLFQAGFDSLVDETLLILTSKNDKYILNRGNKANNQFKINKTLNFNKYKNEATYVIYNDNSLKEFKNNIRKISK